MDLEPGGGSSLTIPGCRGLDPLSFAEGQCVDDRPVNLEDARDVRATLEGDGEAYGRLVTRYQQDIARYLWRFTRDRTAHDELVQDVFVEAYYSLRNYEGRGRLLAWLRRIATRCGYRYWKRRKGVSEEPALPLDAAEEAMTTPDTDPDPAEAAETAHAILRRLPPRDRLVLTLLYLEERSVEQIAELTGWSRTMVKVQAYRARGKVKKLFEK